MTVVKKTSANEELDLKILILNLWKQKYLVLSITFLFLVFGYFYTLTLNKNVEFTSRIKTQQPPLEYFSIYEAFFDEMKIPFRGKSFIKTFNLNMFSLDNIEKFVDQGDDLNDFKNYLKKNDQTVREFFEPNFKQAKMMDDSRMLVPIEGEYLLTSSSILDTNKFLNSYANYIKDLTISEFKKQKIIQILNIRKVYEQNLDISEAISLDHPLIQNLQGVTQSNILTEPVNSFYQGNIVIGKRIEHLDKMLKILKKNFDYNPISESAIVISSTFKNTTYPLIFAIIIGIIFSIFVILFRTILK
jgi:LPS O-antigen subunit length determinant protein (WzzB/FepE family)